MKKLVIQHYVYAEVEEVWLWYENIIPRLGDQFLDEWERVLDHVERHPLHFRKRKKEFRLALLSRFPYIITFVIEVREIVVYGLIHVKRKVSRRYRKSV